MNKEIMKALGFEAEVRRVENNFCPFCDFCFYSDDIREMSPETYTEYLISGLCPTCQNEMFPPKEKKNEG